MNMDSSPDWLGIATKHIPHVSEIYSIIGEPENCLLAAFADNV